MSLTLVIGGTRSGKSGRAETLALATGLPVRYVATADGSDPAMAERIRRHAERRPASWTTVEAGAQLGDALADTGGACVLLDGLGPWVATALHGAGAFDNPDAATLEAVRERVMAEIELLARAAAGPDPLIVVAEEAGQGVLPPDAASRAWLDLVGDAKRRLAEVAERVELVVAGRPLALGGAPGPAEGLRGHGDAELSPGLADHAVNVLSGGPPDWLRAILHETLDANGHSYPDERHAAAALAALHGRAPEEVVPTNGAAEALWLLPAALRPTLAACVHPAFTEAEAALRAHGVPVTRVLRDPERDFALDPAAVPDAADLVVVGNPASPSGTLDPAAALLALRRPGRVVAVDEAFMDLVPGEPGSLVRERLDDVIVVRSLTKSMALPGVRAGYAVAAPALAERLRTVRPPWSANALALAALTAIAERPHELAAAAERADGERADLAERLDRLAGVRMWPGAANFCLIEVADGPGVVAALREHGIAVRPAASFPGLGPGHLRVTARSAPENERVARALAEAVES
ncbi:MAG: histidinol-phosphate aminotransferase [Thermoleophilaceae bacterium]|jgi:histidinol-phosphate/aromatic aminotransferase/cobyric acid decarboxylase-like protein/adenosyl cobinamide kinase/adenosyl cobinamide phosphate guanylyltransferase|nr:histidinol-phosphate aminotransferase [Thermoleophilaceae bacterium]